MTNFKGEKMKIKLYPSYVQGQVDLRGSKSYEHRALIVAAFLNKKSTIYNFDLNDDIKETMNVLSILGTNFHYNYRDKIMEVSPHPLLKHLNEDLEINESGTTLRMLVPLLCYFYNRVTIKTSNRLLIRIKNTEDPNFLYSYEENKITITKNFSNIVRLSDDLTTQYISGFIMLQALTSMVKVIIKTTELNNYNLMTIDTLNKYGFKLDYVLKENNIEIVSRKNYNFNYDFYIEKDLSLMGNFLCMGALNGDLKITNVNLKSLQGDLHLIDVLTKMHGNITTSNDFITVSSSSLVNQTIDVTNLIDVAPLIMGISAVSKGVSMLTGFSKLYNKEVDRLTETINILTKLGGSITMKEGKIEIIGKPYLDNVSSINLPNDHRLIMMVISISSKFKEPLIIDNVEALNKSCPDFLQLISTIGLKYEVIK